MDKIFKRKKQETVTNDDEEEDLEEGVDLPLLPKRTKVQAQRKFAQGSSPMVTPVKEPPAELDTTPVIPPPPVFTQPPINQPKTEDFLTYLCFRGTSLVSRRLSDMFSTPSPLIHNTSDQKNASGKKVRKKQLTEEDLKGKSKLSRQKTPAAQLKKLKQQDQSRMRGVKPQPASETKSSSKKVQPVTKENVAKKLGVRAVPAPGRKAKPAAMLRKVQMTQRERLKSRHATSSVASNRSGLRSSGLPASGTEEGLPPRKRLRHSTLASAVVKKGQGAATLKRVALQNKKLEAVVKKERTAKNKASEDSVASKTSVTTSVRPSRKSKEAAAVYMDLLGEEVKNPQAFNEDDNSSVESFPELPKAKTIERRERQIREMAAAQVEDTEVRNKKKTKSSTQPKILSPRLASKLTVQSLLKKRMTRSSLKQTKLRKQPIGKDDTLDKRKTRAKLRDTKHKVEESTDDNLSRSSSVTRSKLERTESPKLRKTRNMSPVVAIDALSPGKLSKVIIKKDDSPLVESKSNESKVDEKTEKSNTKEEKKVEDSKSEDRISTRATRSKGNVEVDSETPKTNKKESERKSEGIEDKKEDKADVNTTPKNLDARSKNEADEKIDTKKSLKKKPGVKQKINFDEIVRDETFVSKNRAAKSTNDERKGKPESQGKAKKKKDIEENNVTVFVTKVDVEKVVDSGSPLKPTVSDSKANTTDSTDKPQAVKAISFEDKDQTIPTLDKKPSIPSQEILKTSSKLQSNLLETDNKLLSAVNKPISVSTTVLPINPTQSSLNTIDKKINDNKDIKEKRDETTKVQIPSVNSQNNGKKCQDKNEHLKPVEKSDITPELHKTTEKKLVSDLTADIKKILADSRNSASTKVKRIQMAPSKLVPNSSHKKDTPESSTVNSKDNVPSSNSSILNINSNSTLKPRSRATLFGKGVESPMTQMADTFRLNFTKKEAKSLNKKEANISESTIAELDKELSNFVKDIVKSDWEGKKFDIPLNTSIKPMTFTRDTTGNKSRKQISTIDFINSTPVKCSSSEDSNVSIRNDKVIISPLRKLTENEIRILLAQESPMKMHEKSQGQSEEVFNTVENLSRSKLPSEAEDTVSKLCIEKITNEIISLIDPKMNLAETQDIIKKYNLNKQLHSRLTEERQVTTSSHKLEPVTVNKLSSPSPMESPTKQSTLNKRPITTLPQSPSLNQKLEKQVILSNHLPQSPRTPEPQWTPKHSLLAHKKPGTLDKQYRLSDEISLSKSLPQRSDKLNLLPSPKPASLDKQYRLTPQDCLQPVTSQTMSTPEQTTSLNLTQKTTPPRVNSPDTKSQSRSYGTKPYDVHNTSKVAEPKTTNKSIDISNTNSKNLNQKPSETSNSSLSKSLDKKSTEKSKTGSCDKLISNSLNRPSPTQTFSEVPITLSNTFQTIILNSRDCSSQVMSNSPNDSSTETLKSDSKSKNVNNVQKADCDKSLSRNRAHSIEEDNNMIADFVKDSTQNSTNPERQIIKAFEDKYEPKSSPTKNIRKYSSIGKKSPGKNTVKQGANITKSLRSKKDTNYLEDFSSTDTSEDDLTSKTSAKSVNKKRKPVAATKENPVSESTNESEVDEVVDKIQKDEKKKPKTKNEDLKKPETQKSTKEESSAPEKCDLRKPKRGTSVIEKTTEKKEATKPKNEEKMTENRRLRNKQSVLYNLESLETDSDTPDEEIIPVKRKGEENKKRKGKKSSASENENENKADKIKQIKTEIEKPKRGRKKKQTEESDHDKKDRVEDEMKETSDSESDVKKKKVLKKRGRKQNSKVTNDSSESEEDDKDKTKKITRKRAEDLKEKDESGESSLKTEECGTRKNLRRKPCHLYAENLSSNSEDDLELLIQNRCDEIETQDLMNHPRKSKKLLDQILAKSKLENEKSKRSSNKDETSSDDNVDDDDSKQSKGRKKNDKSKKKPPLKQTKQDETQSESEQSSKTKKDKSSKVESPLDEERSRRASRTQSLIIDTSEDSDEDPLLAIAKTISRNEVRMSRRSIDLLHAKEKEILKKTETSEEEEDESEDDKEEKVAKKTTTKEDEKKLKKSTTKSVDTPHKTKKDAEKKEELQKPIAVSGKSSECSSSKDVSKKISSLIEKDKQKRGLDNSKDKETSSVLQQEAVQRLEKQPNPTPDKKPMSREQLHSSWKSAFQNLKLPKTSPSVSKTPMDRNAWIRKHAILPKPKPIENKAHVSFEPFKINYSRSSSPISLSSHNSDHIVPPVGGKHHNLPMPVEQTLKRMANISPKVNKSFQFEKAPPPGKIEDIPKAGNFNENIMKWLNDSIPNDDSSCDDTNSCKKTHCDDTDTSVASSVIDKGIVSAPVQLKDIFSSPVSFTSEKISSVKVDDYKKLKQKNIFTSPSLERKVQETPEKRKHMESETDSLLSDMSSCDEAKHEKKAIFQQRRSLAERLKERQNQSSLAKVAFSPQNESSVYAFEAEPQETSPSTPFRRSNSKNTTPSPSPSISKPGSPCNSSIAVQVNFESETVLECSTTQTELSGSQGGDDGHLFYIPLQKNGQTASSAIQGVAVKLGTEGPDQRVIMSAKLVTTPPSSDFAKPSTVSCLVPQRRVRPFNTPIVGTVQPMSRPTTGTQVSPRSQHTQTPPPPPKPSASSTTSSSSASTTTTTTKSGKKGKSKTSSSTTTSSIKKARVASPEPSTSCASPSLTAPSTPAVTAVKHKTFPSKGSRALMVEAPTYYPTEKEFQDPFEYIEKIRPAAEQFGICRIVPPSSFKPECKLNDDMRFTAYNQYVHKMLHRWGPNVKEMVAIRKYLATQSVSMQQLPVIGGIEVDLPRLYSTVQQCGGLSEVIEKKRWPRVADLMRIPRLAQDRLSKLDDIYCKYLLPYDTLGHDERSKLFDAVEAEWGTHFNSSLEEEDEEEEEDENNDDELDECIVKGRSIPLSAFYRIARNTMAMYFKSDNPNDPGSNPSPTEVETEFWNHVTNRMLHICVHSASIDTGSNGCGFPTAKNSTFAKHPWNLKVLTNNSASILRSLNNLVGITVPTLHVAMLFSACCWYRDPHGLPWIEYLHSGASKIWYSIPDEHSTAFRSTMMSLFPHYCHSDRTIWLSSDVAMVPPSLLTEKGVSLSRVVQDPGQFVLVFPSAFTSSIATGYLVAESVYFARASWLDTCERAFKDMQDSSEPSEFSLELLLFAIAADSRSNVQLLSKVLPMIESLRDLEIAYRSQLLDLGLKKQERISTGNKKGRKKTAVTEEEEEHECDVCRAHLPISMVQNTEEEEEEIDYCLRHGIETLTQNMEQLKHCKLLYYYDEAELADIITKLKDKIKSKSLKKVSEKNSV